MTPEQINTRIAEIVKWKCNRTDCNTSSLEQCGHYPNYFGDLNAMHEAEMLTLRSLGAVERYRVVLSEVLAANFAVESDITACADYRAEALLRVHNKWEE